MDIETICGLFTLFSGEDSDDYLAIITMSMTEAGHLVKSDTSIADERLNYLCAALANYHYHQAMCSRQNAAVTYAGKMNRSQTDISLAYAEKLLRSYMALCHDIMKATDFIFIGFSGGGRSIPC